MSGLTPPMPADPTAAQTTTAETTTVPYLSDRVRLDLGLLALRVVFGTYMIVGHGWSKLIRYTDIGPVFADPIGVGSWVTLTFAVFAEVFCSAAIVLGAFTKFAAIAPFLTMVLWRDFVNFDDPWAKEELEVLYGTVYVVFMLLGGGRFALTRRWKGS